MKIWFAAIAVATAAACGNAGERTNGSAVAAGGSTNFAGSGGRAQAGASGDGGPVLEVFDKDGGTACERVVEFEAVTLEEPPPFDVIIVADHSDSLSWSKDDLARGLATLLTNLRGRDVRLFVLTPTQYGASTEAAEPWLSSAPLISWKDPVTGQPYPNAMTEYHAECTDANAVAVACPDARPPSGTTLTVEGHWDFRMPDPVAEISRDMTEAELTATTQAVSNAILGLGGGGAQVEQPVCTLARYVHQDPSVLPEHAVFLVISDEDDTTDGRSCLVGHTTSFGVGEMITTCYSDCDEYHYNMTADGPGRLSFQFDCVPVDDFGTPFPELAEHRTSFSGGGGCAPVGTQPCTQDELDRNAIYCEPGSVAMNCTATCPESSRTTCFLTRSDDRPICSTSFQEGGTTYANFADYCSQTHGLTGWDDCQEHGYTRTQNGGSGGSFVPHRLVTAVDTQQLIRSFQSKATDVFGPNGYKVQTILLDPAFPCEPQMGQSYGTNLRELASSPEDVFAICEPYDKALTGVEGFAASLIQTEYPLVLERDEQVISVRVTDRDGRQRELALGTFQHDADAGVLTFRPGALSANDTALDVEVAADCRPR